MVWYENGMVWEWYENNLYNPQANFAEYQPNSNDYMKVVMQLLFFNCLHYIWWQIFHNVIYWVLSVCTKCKRVSIHASFVFLTPASWGPTISSVFDPQKPYFSGQDWCVPWLHIPSGQFDMSVHITHSLSVEIIASFSNWETQFCSHWPIEMRKKITLFYYECPFQHNNVCLDLVFLRINWFRLSFC